MLVTFSPYCKILCRLPSHLSPSSTSLLHCFKGPSGTETFNARSSARHRHTQPCVTQRKTFKMPQLFPTDPSSTMVIRAVTPEIITFSLPFARFGIVRFGARGTLGEYCLLPPLQKKQDASPGDPEWVVKAKANSPCVQSSSQLAPSPSSPLSASRPKFVRQSRRRAATSSTSSRLTLNTTCTLQHGRTPTRRPTSLRRMVCGRSDRRSPNLRIRLSSMCTRMGRQSQFPRSLTQILTLSTCKGMARARLFFSTSPRVRSSRAI